MITQDDLRVIATARMGRRRANPAKHVVHQEYDRDTRIGAVADWLVGVPVGLICSKWNVPRSTLHKWTRAMYDHFKSRHREELKPIL